MDPRLHPRERSRWKIRRSRRKRQPHRNLPKRPGRAKRSRHKSQSRRRIARPRLRKREHPQPPPRNVGARREPQTRPTPAMPIRRTNQQRIHPTHARLRLMLPLQRLLRNPNEPGALGNQNRYGFRWENQKASEECEKSSGQRGIVQKNSSKNGLIAGSLWFLDGESFFSFLLSLHLAKNPT